MMNISELRLDLGKNVADVKNLRFFMPCNLFVFNILLLSLSLSLSLSLLYIIVYAGAPALARRYFSLRNLGRRYSASMIHISFQPVIFMKKQEAELSNQKVIVYYDNCLINIILDLMNEKKKFFRKWDTWRRLLCLICILSVGTLAAFGQKRVTGTVTDAKGETVIGANVVEKGTTNGTVTDAAGAFSLEVKGNAVLQVSFIGYVTQEITVGNQSSFRVTLLEDSRALDEVVVVGYGVQQKRDLTGSIVNVKGDKIKNIPVVSAANALQGRVTGVDFVTSDGRPGEQPNIRIRGTGTINGAEPLVVIDGIP
ncbi:MAG: carboxypeptidase-like regulatory domain-containing protein, partial [Tannerella sp.]|nr:carboxypeptidase-like regulatory domain-containing protein [Tannerella sp.]